jgi:DNA ligase 1
MLSAYTIGKEKVFLEVARRCGVQLCVTQAKWEVMQLLPWPEDLPAEKIFTTDPHSSRVHVVGMNWLGETWPFFRPNYSNMEIHAQL